MSRDESRDEEIRETMGELQRFEGEFEKFRQHTLQKVDALQGASDGLEALSDRWAKTSAKNQRLQIESDSFKGKEIFQADGSRFVEAEELQKVVRLKNDLKACYNGLPEKIQWLTEAMAAMEKATFYYHDESVLESLHELYTSHSYHEKFYDFHEAAFYLGKALDLLESMDFSADVVSADLLGPKFIPKLLREVSKKVKDASGAVRIVAAMLWFSEGKWEELSEKLNSGLAKKYETNSTQKIDN